MTKDDFVKELEYDREVNIALMGMFFAYLESIMDKNLVNDTTLEISKQLVNYTYPTFIEFFKKAIDNYGTDFMEPYYIDYFPEVMENFMELYYDDYSYGLSELVELCFEERYQDYLISLENKTLYILYGPSASGKTTISQLLESFDIPFLVSHTTRDIRKGEVEGEDYYFVSDKEFNELELLESVEHAGNRYGLSRQELYKKFKQSDIVTVVTEKNGIKQLENSNLPCDIVKVFILAPHDEIKQRLSEQGREDRYKHDVEHNRFTEYNEVVPDEIIYNQDGKLEYSIKQFYQIAEYIKHKENVDYLTDLIDDKEAI